MNVLFKCEKVLFIVAFRDQLIIVLDVSQLEVFAFEVGVHRRRQWPRAQNRHSGLMMLKLALCVLCCYKHDVRTDFTRKGVGLLAAKKKKSKMVASK